VAIKAIFQENCCLIEHVGSSAVPGLAAKPTIDIILIVNNILQFDTCEQAMEQLGYEAWGEYGISGRRFF
jgi:GrpB-like predicted nucleotidyltransferase (UPF0157 family)